MTLPECEERQYQKYAAYCALLKMPAADRLTWARTQATISATRMVDFSGKQYKSINA